MLAPPIAYQTELRQRKKIEQDLLLARQHSKDAGGQARSLQKPINGCNLTGNMTCGIATVRHPFRQVVLRGLP